MTLLLCLALIGSQEPVAGANDDYLRAAAIVASAGDELRPVTEGNVLEWAQNATEKYGTALDWIRVGNQKPFEPLAGRRQDGDFRELADFRAVGFLYEARVFELIADGKPNQAADALIDALTFGRRVQSIATLGHIVGSQIIERNLRMFDLNRRAFAEDGLEKLSRLELIKAIPADQTAMQLELLAVEKLEKLDTLPSDERARVRARIAELKEATRVQFESEEADWKWGADDEWFEQLFGVGTALSTTWQRAFVIRTKLRLLTATARVLLYEVRNYKLPDAFSDVHDPATGKPFFYGKRDDAFVMYSDGVEKTGRIELGTLWNNAR
jgi:hypothetical protein